MSRDPGVRARGIDVEPAEPLVGRYGPARSRPESSAGIDAHLAFTAKEAANKAWSVLVGGRRKHHDVRLVATSSNSRPSVAADGARFLRSPSPPRPGATSTSSRRAPTVSGGGGRRDVPPVK